MEVYMPTAHPRLNVVLEPRLYAGISHLASRQGISRSLAARDLLKEALELHEDAFWSEKATERRKTFSAKKVLSHKEVWG
jgi:predicted DNA-binding protein